MPFSDRPPRAIPTWRSTRDQEVLAATEGALRFHRRIVKLDKARSAAEIQSRFPETLLRVIAGAQIVERRVLLDLTRSTTHLDDCSTSRTPPHRTHPTCFPQRACERHPRGRRWLPSGRDSSIVLRALVQSRVCHRADAQRAARQSTHHPASRRELPRLLTLAMHDRAVSGLRKRN